jgi:raffinose/stachyose/melibiose transport system permease protein
MAGDIKSTNTLSKAIMYIVVIIFTVLALYPIYWLVIQSFKTTQVYMTTSKLSLPKVWYTENYPWTWVNGKFTTLFLNSIFYTTVSVFSIIVLSFMAGFAFAKLPSKLTPLLHGSFIIGILLTLQSILVPLFLMINAVNLYNTRIGVLIPYVGLGLPMSVYLASSYMKSIPEALIESARMDGAKYLRIFSSIILPMSAPVAATVAIISTTGVWNEFIMINILVSADELKSLPIGVNRFSGALAADYGKQFSALVIGMLPMVIFYVIFRKQITKGVSAGAVKG